ncbi:DNA polymerase-4 [Granulicella aggregans]|uniref:DNA polymerase IV n=1 Tax=Granulicella aggregans TaxID=474949 RepID=A0A7W8E3L8_9BACT|nr:DNA polymerase IV [Granulicella aggregans]MBB5056270.1 DNA polymerase-4 [Granulicella aggregans]
MSEPPAFRKIVHVDMDAFYASVEQRDNPELRGRPVVVAWRGARSVVCASSYEARKFGIRSAMPAVRAERLCPEAVFLPPDFVRYKAVSRAVREIFERHTDLIEPLSLDEAYLDVTENKLGLATATRVAKRIRQEIREELNLTASAGVAPNKFLAKIASDWKKPDGLFVIQPHEVESFLVPLPVGRIPGVGQVTEARMKAVGIATVGDLCAMERTTLEGHFGRYGRRLYELARGIDHNPVIANRASKSISAEDTFPVDIPLPETEPLLRKLAEKVWAASRQNARMARTVVLKLKTKEFNTLTRSLTPPTMPVSLEEFADVAVSLAERVDLGPGQLFRLVGVGLSNFQVEQVAETPLFTHDDDDEDLLVPSSEDQSALPSDILESLQSARK